MIRAKVYVEVMAKFDKEGNMTPISVVWEDGTIYEIEKVLDVRRSSCAKAGREGLRYVVCIGNAKAALFYEDPAWFVERKRK